MPSNSIAIISPVTGETVPASDPLAVTIDYGFYYRTNAWVGALCSAPLGGTTSPHISGVTGPIGIGTPSSVEAGLGTHTANFTGVTIEARILSTNSWGSYYNSALMTDLNIALTPPFRLDRPSSPPTPFFYRLAPEGRFNVQDKSDAWEADGLGRYDPAVNAPQLFIPYKTTEDLVLTGTIADPANYTGSISAVVNGRVGDTGLALVYTVPAGNIVINRMTGNWTVTIPAAILAGTPSPRQAVLSLFTAAANYVATISTALKKT